MHSLGYGYADDIERLVGQFDLIYNLGLPTAAVKDYLHGASDRRGYANVDDCVQYLLRLMRT